MELFKKKGSKFYWYDFKLPGVPRQRASTKETNETRAKKIAAIRLAEAMEGKYPLRQKVPILAQQWERFKASAMFTSLDSDTQRYYANGWRLMQDSRLAKMRITEIRGSDVTAVAVSGSASNVNNARRTVRRLLNVAALSGSIAKCPPIELLQENERNVLFDEASEAAILPHAPQPLKDVVILMRQCGMRNARELYPMKIENLDWNGKRYFVPDSKSPTGKREIPLTDKALDILRERCGDRTEGYVFPSVRKGKHITGGLVNKQWVKARKAAGLPKCMVLYSGRHDFGTYLMESTGNLKAVMMILGHKDTKATLRYLRPRMDPIREVLNKRNKKAAVLKFRAQSVAQR